MADAELFGNSEQLDDTISRRGTVKAIRDAMLAWSSMPQWREDKIVDAVKALPSAQPERKKGKWIYHSEIGWGDTWLCDQCGEKTTSTVMGKPRANYCPMCGADMRGKQDG